MVHNLFWQVFIMHIPNLFLTRLHEAFLALPFCFMGSNRPKGCEELFPNGTELRTSVSHWTKDILKSDVAAQCIVLAINHYKYGGGMEHEFITVEFRHPSNAKNFLLADRTTQSTSSVSLVSSSLSSAHDRIIVSPDGVEDKLWLQSQTTHSLRTLRFSHNYPNVIDFAIILRIICELAPHYHLYKTQCYWFVATTWESIKALFPHQEQAMNQRKRPGYCYRFKTDHNIPTDRVVQEYYQRRQRYYQELQESTEGATQRQERVSFSQVLAFVHVIHVDTILGRKGTKLVKVVIEKATRMVSSGVA
jgi:hypothetical protein